MTTRVTVIINPISGTGGRPDVVRARLQQADVLTHRHGVDARIVLTEHPGHARVLAEAALAAGETTILAWGGDGTMNEVASALVYRPAVLGLVPSGSGNGLARELRIPLAAEGAFAVALSGGERTIDACELDGHLFFNIAGIGLDARVAHEFAAHGQVRRGFRRYLEITARELCRPAIADYTLVVDGRRLQTRALLVAIANGRQYGHGAQIAPDARLDDGQMDVVVVEDRPAWRGLVQMPRVFMGQITRLPGVRVIRGARVEISAGAPMLYHVDGEPFAGAAHLNALVHPAALRIRVPA